MKFLMKIFFEYRFRISIVSVIRRWKCSEVLQLKRTTGCRTRRTRGQREERGKKREESTWASFFGDERESRALLFFSSSSTRVSFSNKGCRRSYKKNWTEADADQEVACRSCPLFLSLSLWGYFVCLVYPALTSSTGQTKRKVHVRQL